MNILLMSIGDAYATLAQIQNPTPQAPPPSDKLLQMVRAI